MITLAIIQTAVPLTALVWLVFFSFNQLPLYIVQVVCVAVLILSSALTGMWVLPPWWTPYLIGLVYVITLIIQCWQRTLRDDEQPSNGLIGKSVLGLGVLVALYGVSIIIEAIHGRSPDDSRIVNIASPLSSGSYIVAQGGSNESLNHHYKTMDESVSRFANWRGQSRGIDIIRIDQLGFRAAGLLPESPKAYFTFGTPVLSPCDGTVAKASDGVRDMPVPQMDRDNMLGNYVIIKCDGFYVVLAHFKEGSVGVSQGQVVSTGNPLGEMGNSGNSGEPHLHIHAQNELPPDTPISGDPLNLKIDNVFYAKNDRINAL